MSTALNFAPLLEVFPSRLFKLKPIAAMLKHHLFPLAILASTALFANAQSTALRVYNILQEKCVQCHSPASPSGGLDLRGNGSTEQERALEVYNRLYQGTPNNGTAAQAGDAYIYPGRTDKSYLFRKINDGLEPTLSLQPGEGQSMPLDGQPALNDEEKELIRQWILFGAPLQGEAVDENLIAEYYAGNAIQSFPDGPPPAPAPDEGFQIKMGPFYLEPGGELEFFQKYELDLPADQEVTRLDMQIGTFSHHFILYDFNPGGAQSIPPGLRLAADHSNIGLVAAIQEPTDLELPGGTAFFWDDQLVLDLNAHYINYSATAVYQAEVYVNVYTQPMGTAAQEMRTELIPNFDIYIPNDGNEVTYSQVINYNLGEVFLWGLMGHTHQYGTSYKAYQREADGSETLIYDGACPRGEPGCVSPFFDYQHIPLRYFEPLRPLMMSPQQGLRHEASWVNNGPSPVGFGPTSDDEMMVMIMMFTQDTVGLNLTSTNGAGLQPAASSLYPNPTDGPLQIEWGVAKGSVEFQLLDMQGRMAASRILPAAIGGWQLALPDITAGLYYYRLRDEAGRLATGKVVVSR
jgi:hypothetical protein